MERCRHLCHLARRKFLGWLLAASGTAVGAAILYPVLKYLDPPESSEAATDSVTLPLGPGELVVTRREA